MLQLLDRFRKGVSELRQPMWLPRTSSTGRRWWMHGKSWVRPTPQSARQPAWFQRGGRRRGELIPATYADLPSSGALSSQATCRRWRKRSSSPCLPRARKRRQPEDVYPPSRRWPPWGGSPRYNGTDYGDFQRRQWIPRGSDSLGRRTSSSLWVSRAPGWGSGRYTQQRSCPLPRYAEWGKSRHFEDRTSPRWGLRTKASSETTARSHDDPDRTRRLGLHGSAGSHRVRHQRWDVQQTSKWVWPSSCKGLTEVRHDGIPGDGQALHTSVGWDCRGGTSCGGADGIASKLHTCRHLPPTNLNVCRLRDCLGPANEGIQWRKTDIRDLWPPSLTELFKNDEAVRKLPANDKRTRSKHSDGGAARGTRRSVPAAWREEDQNPGARIPRKPQGREHQRTSSLPGGTRYRHGVGHPAPHRKPPAPPEKPPSTLMNSRTWRWVPRHVAKPMGERDLPCQVWQEDDSKDNHGVSRRGEAPNHRGTRSQAPGNAGSTCGRRRR